MNEYLIDIPGRLHSVAVEEHVAGTDLIYDDFLKTTLDILNLENITDVKVQDGKLQFLNILGLVLKEISRAFGQKQSDWNLTDSTQVDFIKNKPTIYNKLEVDDKLIAKQDIINDLVTIRSGAELGATAYQKPQSGIPSADLASDVQSDLAAIGGIEEVIPTQASSSNQLADKNFVNSSIATNTANYISDNGQPFQSVEDLEAYSGVLTNNDYAFVVGVDSVGNTTYSRYKYSASAQQWALEYALNNSSFTAEQWAAINSSITSGLVTKLSALPTNSELTTLLSGKANKIPMPPVVHELVVEGSSQVSDVIVLIAGTFWQGSYTDITSTWTNTTSIAEFSTNYQGVLRFNALHPDGRRLEYIRVYRNDVLVKTSSRDVRSYSVSIEVQTNDIIRVEFTLLNPGDYFSCGIKPLSVSTPSEPMDLGDMYNSLASVATTGSYNDLSDKPDLSSFITRSVDDLTNYYLKSETYTKTEVQQLIGAIQQFHYEVYPTLPQTGASNVLYLIGPTGSGSDKYEEYVYANNSWAKIGDTSIDLSGYVTTQALNTALADYVTSSALSVTLANYYNKTEVDGLFAGKANKSEMSVVPGTGADADKTTITLKQGTSATVLTAHQDVAAKQDKMAIVQVASGTTSINAAVNTYYEVAGEVGTLAITLPAPTDLTNVSIVVAHLTSGTTPNVVIGSTATIDYSAAYDISASKEYEINCLFNGDKWVVADMEVV